jgi:hypothetical protein
MTSRSHKNFITAQLAVYSPKLEVISFEDSEKLLTRKIVMG